MQNRLFGLPFSLIVALMVILGALFHREFPRVGEWVVTVAIVAYLVYNLKFAIWVARGIKRRELKEIALLAIYVGFAVMIPTIVVSHSIQFFLIVFFLACDYLIKDKNE